MPGRQQRVYQQQSILYGHDILTQQFKKEEAIFDQENQHGVYEYETGHHNCEKVSHKSSVSGQSRQGKRQGINGRFGSGLKSGDSKTNVNLTENDIFPIPSNGDDEHFAWLNQWVIRLDSSWKKIFDFVMLLASCQSIIFNAYYAVFGLPSKPAEVTVDWLVESLFFFDIVFTFLEEYNEEETHLVVSSVRQIAWHYLRTNFIFDLVAWFPVEYCFHGRFSHELSTASGFAGENKLRLVRLLKLLRLPRTKQLLNAGKFKEKLNSYYSKQLKNAAKDESSTFRYPVMRILNIVNGYHIFSVVATILASAYIFAIFWLVFSIDLQTGWKEQWGEFDTFFTIEKHGFLSFSYFPYDQERVVLSSEEESLYWVTDLSNFEILVKSMYYALTTLTTIGYGDMSPITISEKTMGCVILLFGVALFSHFIGFLQEILERKRQLTKVDQFQELQTWMAILTRFNGGSKLPRDLESKIESFFEFYWMNNRLSAFESDPDKRLVSELPSSALEKIYIDFLFADFLKVYQQKLTTLELKQTRKFNIRGPLKMTALNSLMPIDKNEEVYRKNIVQLLKVLEPRKYVAELLIQGQYDEVFEVLYLMKGKVGVSYRLFNETAIGVVLQRGHVINDYAFIVEKVSEFSYQAILEDVEGLAIRRREFTDLLQMPYWQRMAESWQVSYQRRIQAPMAAHREEMAEKFHGLHSANIDERAFGVGVEEKTYTPKPRQKINPNVKVSKKIKVKKSEFDVTIEECLKKLEFMDSTCNAVLSYLQVQMAIATTH